MAGQDQPKILTRVTVPTGGWTLTIKVSISSSLDTTVQATMAAGNYYMAWDNQADDFMWELSDKLNTALDAESGFGRDMIFWIDSDRKVNIACNGSGFQGTGNDVQILWLSDDGDEIGAVLGFDTGASLTATGAANPTLTAESAHGYGWYVDEDGDLANHLVHDREVPRQNQAKAIGGKVKTQYAGSIFENVLSLKTIPFAKTYSGEISYGTTPAYGMTKNEPLECWWREARLGTPFRVYRNGRYDHKTSFNRSGTLSATTTTTADPSGAMTVDEFKGMLYTADSSGSDVTANLRWNIASNTATRITMSQASGNRYTIDTAGHWITDGAYREYVLDFEKLRDFAPMQNPGLDRYDIDFPLLRFIA